MQEAQANLKTAAVELVAAAEPGTFFLLTVPADESLESVFDYLVRR